MDFLDSFSVYGKTATNLNKIFIQYFNPSLHPLHGRRVNNFLEIFMEHKNFGDLKFYKMKVNDAIRALLKRCKTTRQFHERVILEFVTFAHPVLKFSPLQVSFGGLSWEFLDIAFFIFQF